jgi:hypothetical protein
MTKKDNFQDIKEQAISAIKAFTASEDAYGKMLQSILADVQRASKETLEIFPVCHHSPSSGLFMIKRLQEKQPKVLFLELCEDMQPIIEHLKECKFPVALQAFSLETDGFPTSWTPLNVIAPITEFSAEYQAIAYALEQEIPIVFVDRSADHIFQWLPQEDEQLEKEIIPKDKDTEQKEANIHGSAFGVQMGDLRPSFKEFEAFLLKNAQVNHYSEWWEKYIEESLIGASYDSYRQVFFFIGSLFRRLRQNKDQYEVNCQRERYMWQRMKTYLQENEIDTAEAIYICGAFHAVSDIPEFGMESKVTYSIPEKSKSKWLYGIIPSSYFGIEYQFGLPSGTIALAEQNWKKYLKKQKIKAFSLEKKKKNAPLPLVEKTDIALNHHLDNLYTFLGKQPNQHQEDTLQLTQWCANIVRLARKNGYMASSADSIAIFQTSILLANLRNRNHPTPYDFIDAAVTCLEKEDIPQKRNITQVCSILFGGDRQGNVGYLSLPPLVQHLLDGLTPLGKNLASKTKQRILIDFKKNPEFEACSMILWQLNYLLGSAIARPIMGDLQLGRKKIQESWDVYFGKNQRALIELGYEGVNIEYVLEKRLKTDVYGVKKSALKGLLAVEASILFIQNPRLTEELGLRSIVLLEEEDSINEAPQILKQVRKLINYYRGAGIELPAWLNSFIKTGYSHYCTLLPTAFQSEEVGVKQVSAMASFVISLQNLAISFGSNRQQLVITIQQSSTIDPAKQAVLWTIEVVLGLRASSFLSPYFDKLLQNPLRLNTLPAFIKGFILTLDFSKVMVQLIVELLSKAFEQLPDAILFAWLPKLISTLQQEKTPYIQQIIKEAALLFPKNSKDLDNWQPSWQQNTDTTVATNQIDQVVLSEKEERIIQLLQKHPETINNITEIIDLPIVSSVKKTAVLSPISSQISESAEQVKTLVKKYPESFKALEKLIRTKEPE